MINTIRHSLWVVLAAAFTIALAAPAGAATLTYTTSENQFDPGVKNQGWWSSTRSAFNSNDNYLVGSLGGGRHRNFFTFRLTRPCGKVQAARLELTRFDDTNNGTVTYGLFDVSTAAPILNNNSGTNSAIFQDLGSGTSYGSFAINTRLGGRADVLSFPLNAAGVAAVDAARGQFFSIGGALTNPADGQPVAGGGESSVFGSSQNTGTQQLVVDCVTYAVTGLSAPIDNSAVNTVQAGQTVPVKYRVTDPNGVPVSDPAHFTSLTSQSGGGTCGGPPSNATEESAGGSGLQYLGDGNWQVNWKTPKGYSGQCRTMTLTFSDGQKKTAAFQFK